MKRIFTGAILGLLMLVSTAAAEKFSRTETKFFTISPKGKVVVENVNGAIKVEAWDKNQVSLEITKTVRAGDSEEADEYFADLRVEISSGDDYLEVKTRYPHDWGGGFFDWLFHGGSRYGGVEYVLKVPATVNLEVGSTNGGINVREVVGAVKAHSTNGRIELDGVGGMVEGYTTNGGITARLGDNVVFEEMKLSTTNGGISVYCPEGINADVSAHTTNGGIHTDFPITINGNFGSKSLEGKINNGGNEMYLHTTNGGISIYKE
jgi:Toastrack DUF4097